jgi:two-component system NtrC family sensor kinase
MPVMDGPGLYQALKIDSPSYLRRIIYVTGDTLSTHVQAFLAENPVPVIEKPYRIADIRQAIVRLLKEDSDTGNMKQKESAQIP